MRQKPGFYRQVAVLATPIILQNLITSALGMADIFMVGLLGETPMAAVTLVNIPTFVIQLFFFGVQSGGSVLISQYWGKGDRDAINRVMGVGFWVVGIVSTLFALTLFLAPVEFLSLFGNDRDLIVLGAEYGRIVGFSYVFNGFTMVYMGAFRSMEHPSFGMYMLAASMGTNTFLNWVFIFGNLGAPARGVAGAALATLISRMVEFAIMLFHIWKNRIFRLQPRLALAPGRETVKKFIRYGGPVVCNETLFGLGTSLYPTIMGHMEGSREILAAYTIAGNVEKLFTVVAFGLGGTAAILVGREIGAGRSDRVRPVGMALSTLALGCGCVLSVILFLFVTFVAPTVVFPLFQLSEGAIEVATMMLTVMIVMIALRTFNSTNIVGVLRGGGDVKAATLIDVCPLWLLALPLAFFTGLVLRLDIFWVYLALSVEQAAKCLAGLWRLHRGQWVHNLTLPGDERERAEV